jgi:assimilatory nitrate reductase catalytic subunit
LRDPIRIAVSGGPAQETRSTCPYCGVGCGVIIESDGKQITGVRGDPDHPANFGRLCTKGATLHLTATPRVLRDERALTPLLRSRRDEAPQPVGWDAALDLAAERFADVIARHGPDAVAFYISGQLLTEDYYVFNKLAKGLIGTNNVDTNSRLCMSSAVAGYKQSLGADSPPACYDDLALADCLFIAGSNTAWAHPVLFRRIEDARRERPALKIIVVDPRRTETAEFADLHLQIQPGTDVALFHAMLHAMIWDGAVDAGFIADHTSGFDAIKALVREMSPAIAARICGVAEADIVQAAQWFATSPATLSLYCQGLNQSSSGTAKNTALINLHLACGQIGKPGAGPFSLTGQPNAMGGREVGGMANLLSAHRDLANRGEIKALWIACTNPAQSMPDQALVRRALARCEFVVVQDSFAHTATGRYADLQLPASTWGEKEGTVTNSERRISRVRAAVPPPGQARSDWAIAVDFARRLQTRLLPGPEAAPVPVPARDLFAWDSIEATWNEHRASSAGRDLDITGLSWALLDAAGPQQWPFPAGAAVGMARLYEDRRFATTDGRARFIASPYQRPAEVRDARFPIALTTARSRDQWHGMSRSGSVARLWDHDGAPSLRMNPHDLPRRGLASGDLVEVRSRRGALTLPLLADDSVAPTQACAAMHWGDEFVSGHDEQGQRLAGVNAVTSSAFCPDSKQPELKHAAVRVTKVELPWRIHGAIWLTEDDERAASTSRPLRELLSRFDYASCVPVAGRQGRSGWAFHAASANAISTDAMAALTAALDLVGAGVLRYADARRGRCRMLALSGSGSDIRLRALLVVGEEATGRWFADLWRQDEAIAQPGRLLLGPDAGAAPAKPRSAQICNCLDVSEAAIRSCLATLDGSADNRVAGLQSRLRCGTECGSCLPTLRRLAREGVVAVAEVAQ